MLNRVSAQSPIRAARAEPHPVYNIIDASKHPKIAVWYSEYGPYGGEWVAGNSDMGTPMLPVDAGGDAGTDPLLPFELPETGWYYIGVSHATAVAYSWTPTYYQRVGVKAGGEYMPHVSVDRHPLGAVPEPASWLILPELVAAGMPVVGRRRHHG